MGLWESVVRGVPSESAPNIPAWVVIGLATFFMLCAVGRQWALWKIAVDQAAHTPYVALRRGAVMLVSESAAFDTMVMGDVVFPVVTLDLDTRPPAPIRTDILSNLNSCDLARRMGKPCANAQLSFAATDFVGAVRYYGPTSIIQTDGSCWFAPHLGYRIERDNFTIDGDNGKLTITHDSFRDRYHGGRPELVVSDTLCATLTGNRYAVNSWDNAQGDVLGCSSQKNAGPDFVPLQCSIGVGGDTSTQPSAFRTILDMCVTVSDIVRSYQGNTTALRCAVTEDINACGGVAPVKYPTTKVVEIRATQSEVLSYKLVRVAVGVDRPVTFVQWFPSSSLLQDYLLVSDCVVLEPLCLLGEANCTHPTFAQYLQNNGSQCRHAYLIQREFFYAESGARDALKVEVVLGPTTVISLNTHPPATDCTSFGNMTSIGLFVITNAQTGVESERPLATFAMTYGNYAGIHMNVNQGFLGITCLRTKQQTPVLEEEEIVARMAGMAVVKTEIGGADSALQQCVGTGINTVSQQIYNLEECRVPLGTTTVQCNYRDYYCALTATTFPESIGDCECCQEVLLVRVANIDHTVTTTKVPSQIQSCSRCDTDVVIDDTLACVCNTDIVKSISRWVYDPVSKVFPATKTQAQAQTVVFKRHGVCLQRNITQSEFLSGSVVSFSTAEDCWRAHEPCAQGYTRSIINNSTGHETWGCFINEPTQWTGGGWCPSTCTSYIGMVGGQWFAHSHGHCGHNCHSYASIMNGNVDGGTPYTWGAKIKWWLDPKTATAAMGNHFVPHYVCWTPPAFPDGAWTSFLDFANVAVNVWRLDVANMQSVYHIACYKDTVTKLPNLARLVPAIIPIVPS